jgi:fructose-1,6-bisphosphatase/inositol monophosphatase family enzyme
MNPTLDWLHAADKHIRLTLEKLRPKLLETQGIIEHHLKEDKTAVTEMDVLVENELKTAMEELDAGVQFYGEETGGDFSAPTYWVVDPIDGTEPFIRGLPFATNMIALVDNGQPVLSVIYNFALGDYFLAIKGQGATCNGHPIHVSDRPLDRSLMSLSRFPRNQACFGLVDRLRDFTKAEFVNMAASGYALTCVASGAIEARLNYHSVAKPWDIVPGALLVMEAGGRVANIGSDSFDCLNAADLVASNPVVFDQLMQFIGDFDKTNQD